MKISQWAQNPSPINTVGQTPFAMKRRFKKKSALTVATPDLVESVGKAMIVFAAIEGSVNFALVFLIQNQFVWKRIADTQIVRRLDLFADLVSQSPAVTKSEIRTIIDRAKNLFQFRNLIAHSPIVTGGGHSEPRVHKLGGGTQKELSALAISKIAAEADAVYDEIQQLFANYQMGQFDEKSGS